MKRSEIIHKGRYVAKINGARTIVKAYFVHGTNDLLCRDERTGKTSRLTARRLWRPAIDDERHDSNTVQQWDFRTQVRMRDGQDVCFPAECVGTRSEPVHVAQAMYEIAIHDGLEWILTQAGC